MDADGWITTNPKRIKLQTDSSAEVINIEEDDDHSSFRLTSTPEKAPSSTRSLPSSSHSPKSNPRVVIDVKQPLCNYGIKCYRRNPSHLKEFCHPLLEKLLGEMEMSGNFSVIPDNLIEEFNASGMERKVLLEQISILRDARKFSNNSPIVPATSSNTSDLDAVRAERRQKYLDAKKQVGPTSFSQGNSAKAKAIYGKSMEAKWKESKPFNLFLTSVAQIKEENSAVLSCSFSDFFCPSLGEVKALMHVNFMVDPEWFLEQTHKAKIDNKPTRIIFNGESKDLQGLSQAFPWIKVFGVKSPFPFGHHHTKMSIVQYTDNSIRFYIYTANLIESDWENRTQGVWISPRCPKLEVAEEGRKCQDMAGESPTKFRSDIIQYLSTYPIQASRAWVEVIRTADCSDIKVVFIGSAPVTAQSGSTGFQWGHSKMQKILKELNNVETNPDWPLVIQCSSIGTLGKTVDDWIGSEFASSLSGKDRVITAPIHVVYPSHSNVKESFEGLHGGGCLPYSASTHAKQLWLERHLCQWKASKINRSRAVPHIKSYFRLSPDNKQISWFLLTSANLSKAAWGKLSKHNERLGVMSWEAGVLFLPQFMISLSSFSTDSFPLPIDVPLLKYDKGDKPWFFDTLQALILQRMPTNNNE